MRTRLKVYSVVFDPTSKRVVKDERACLRLKIEDSLSARSYWTEPLLPSELAKILGADHESVEIDTTGVALVTALATSAAFNFQSKSDRDGARVAGEPVLPKHPTADMSADGTPAKWIGDIRVRKIPPTREALRKLGVKEDKHGPLQKPRTKDEAKAKERELVKAAANELWAELGIGDLVEEVLAEPQAPELKPVYELIKREDLK